MSEFIALLIEIGFVWLVIYSFYDAYKNRGKIRLTEDDKIDIRVKKCAESYRKLERDHPELTEDELYCCQNIIYNWKFPKQREHLKGYVTECGLRQEVFNLAMRYVVVHDYREDVSEEDAYLLKK